MPELFVTMCSLQENQAQKVHHVLPCRSHHPGAECPHTHHTRRMRLHALHVCGNDIWHLQRDCSLATALCWAMKH